jgi:hypothetical protein
MKKLKLIIIAGIVLLFQSAIVLAQGNKPVTAKRAGQTDKLVKPIEAYARKIEAFVKSEGKPHVIVADVSDYNKSDKAVWKKYTSEDELEKARETEESYTIAYNWKKDGKLVATNFTYSSPSGDWAEYVYYIFREDGSTARAERELRTFMGDLIVNRIYIYDEKGKLLKQTKTFRDLETQKPVKPTDDFQDMEMEIYKSKDNLPFIEILSDGKSDDLAVGDAEKKFIPAGWKLEAKTTGDLNKDGLADSILQLVDENPDAEDFNRSLVILLKTQNGDFTKAAESKKVIRCSSCGGMLGGGPADISVKNGVLLIEQMYGSREGTNYLHRLRYEPATKKFRLIGEDVSNFDRLTNESEHTSTNYLTGRQVIKNVKGGENDTKETVKTKKVALAKKYLEDINYNSY